MIFNLKNIVDAIEDVANINSLSISKTLSDDDTDWEIINKKDIIQDENLENGKHCSRNTINILENKNEKEIDDDDDDDDDDNITVAEADIISQIRLMFIEKNGKQATSLEEREWLKSIREVTENVEEEKEV